MHNILILYNPYYQSDVIEQHLKILNDNGKVAFGKIKSKRRDMINPFEEQIEQFAQELSSSSDAKFLQLFLTDYSNLFVAKSHRAITKKKDLM